MNYRDGKLEEIARKLGVSRGVLEQYLAHRETQVERRDVVIGRPQSLQEGVRLSRR